VNTQVKFMAEKKHVFIFSTAAGEVEVATDDVRELSQYPWFMKFFSGEATVPKIDNGRKSSVDEENEQYIDEDELNKEIEQRAYAMAKEMVRSYQEAEAHKIQPGQQAVAVQDRAAQQASSSEQLYADVSQQAQSPKMTFMDYPPDRMSDDMWASLTKEQQRSYADKYVPSRQK
jgi:hypothetical protein